VNNESSGNQSGCFSTVPSMNSALILADYYPEDLWMRLIKNQTKLHLTKR